MREYGFKLLMITSAVLVIAGVVLFLNKDEQSVEFFDENKIIREFQPIEVDFDKDLFFTSIREFIEETSLLKHTIINKRNISMENFCLDIYNLLDKYKEFFDICVNKNLKYFHRYYIINLDNIEDLNLKKNLINLPKFFNNKFKTELNYIFWYKKNYKIYNKSSWLLKILINKKIYKDFYRIKK